MAESKALQLGGKPPEMTILSDRPSELVEEDLLGLESRLSVVLDILRHKSTGCPITVAIYGDWGTGKTSAMHWLENQLKIWNKLGKDERNSHPRVFPVWFDPWKYHIREDVWRGIISEVILSLFDVENLDRQNFVPRMKEAARKFGAFLGKGFLHALANTELTLKAEGGVPGAAGGAEAKFSGEMFREIYEEFDRASHPEKAYLNQFEDALKSWVKSFLKDDARIALFIDDLDRCLPEVTLEVLEAIKLYLNIPQIIFVVGLDRGVVDGVVAKHYEEHGLGREKAKKYLDKIFQVEVQISPSQTQMTDFHQRQIELLDESTEGYWRRTLADEHRTILEKGISQLAEDNPRELKRLLNSALLRGRAAADNDVLKRKAPDAPLFAQGVQVFLAQKIVQKRFGINTSLMLKNPLLNWFERWSEFVRKNPGFKPPMDGKREGPLPNREEAVKPAGRMPSAGLKEGTAEAAFEAIKNEPLLGEDGKALDKQLLFGEELLWKLLWIPFSAEVAQSAPNSANVPPAKETPGPLSIIPDLVRGRIAKALEKAVDQLTPADLATVQELDFQSSDVGDTDLTHLGNLTSLQSLDLQSTKITDAGLVALEKLTSLQSLNLGGTKITNAGLVSLGKLNSLQSLDLQSTKITDAGLVALEKLTSLQSLNLGVTGITNAGLVSLGKLTSLQSLYLGGTKITNAGLVSLGKLNSLQSLDLRVTGITDAGLVSLGKLTSLRSLSLGGTKITDAGLESLERLTSLQSLYLGGTKITNAGLESLEKLTSLQSLNLGGTGITDAGLESLEKLTSLQSLDLRVTGITDAGLKSLEKLTSLQSLYLGGTGITDAGLESLERLTSLQSLYLGGTKITNAGLESLGKLTSLRSLSLWDTKITDAGLESLEKLTSLQSLDLGGTKITNAGLAGLKKSLPKTSI